MPVLTFKGKTAVENYHHTIPHHTLEFVRSHSVLEKGEDPSLEGNLIVEGDNLLALKALLPTHAGKIKCIYIDPPYNTGNEGWIYNDNLTQPQFKEWIGHVVGKEAEDACRHDKWCCMMYPRLSLLHDLLREDGAIFISIDDNEIHNLRALMDEIYGPENFIANIIWHKIFSPKSSAKFFSESHDYVLAYARDLRQWERNLLPRTEEQDKAYKNPDNDPRGDWTSSDLSGRNYYSKGRYAVKCPGGRLISGPPAGSYWRVSEENLWRLHADHRIWWGEDKNGVPRLKRFHSEVQAGLVPQTIWPYQDVGHTQDAKKEYLEILSGSEVFTTPKPVALIKRILKIATEGDDLVLDSFAGSGTTGHAVMDLNREDGGSRRFVLIQMPHDSKEHESQGVNIAQSITAERLRRVVKGYEFEGTQVETLMEERLTLSALRKAGSLLERVQEVRERAAKSFDEVDAKLDDGILRVEGRRKIKGKRAGLGGSFTYARLGKPLLGAHKSWGDTPPSYEDLARYIYFTETSREIDPKAMKRDLGKIGVQGGTSYYLLYTPSLSESRALDTKFLAHLREDPSPRKVIYCEKIWLHRDDLAKMRETIGEVRPMLLPFQVR